MKKIVSENYPDNFSIVGKKNILIRLFLRKRIIFSIFIKGNCEISQSWRNQCGNSFTRNPVLWVARVVSLRVEDPPVQEGGRQGGGQGGVAEGGYDLWGIERR